MPNPQARVLDVSPLQHELLQRIVHRTTNAQRLVKRGHIILEAAEGISNSKITEHLQVDYEETIQAQPFCQTYLEDPFCFKQLQERYCQRNAIPAWASHPRVIPLMDANFGDPYCMYQPPFMVRVAPVKYSPSS